jgi:enoyl-CoA hydratase
MGFKSDSKYVAEKAEGGCILERKFVNYEVENGIAVVTINNPPMNSLSAAVINELTDVLDELDEKDDIVIAIITGGGNKAFVAGADIKAFGDLVGKREMVVEGSRGMQKCFSKVENSSKVVIAAINGMALGGGCELAVACDIRIIAENALIGVPEVRLGLIPGAGGTQRLVRLVGKGKAKLMCLSGDFYGAKDALEMGLAERVVPAGEAVNEARKMAQAFLGNAPLALRAAKRAINEGSDMSLEDGLIMEASLVGDLFMTEDLREGAAAFLEKRFPAYKGK